MVGQIAQDCEQIIRDKCTEAGWTVVELAIQPDHIHLFVCVFPTIATVEVVKQYKGITSHILRRQYPELLKLSLL